MKAKTEKVKAPRIEARNLYVGFVRSQSISQTPNRVNLIVGPLNELKQTKFQETTYYGFGNHFEIEDAFREFNEADSMRIGQFDEAIDNMSELLANMRELRFEVVREAFERSKKPSDRVLRNFATEKDR